MKPQSIKERRILVEVANKAYKVASMKVYDRDLYYSALTSVQNCKTLTDIMTITAFMNWEEKKRHLIVNTMRLLAPDFRLNC